jgi:hypothetical protein
LTEREKVETDESGNFELKNLPCGNFFLYDAAGNKIPSSRITRNEKKVAV